VERDDVEADSKAKDGMTPLSYAEFGGYEVVVKLPNWHYPYHEAVIGIDLCAIARSPCDTRLGGMTTPCMKSPQLSITVQACQIGSFTGISRQ